jgi:uncharacterized FlgJ-related protein
MQKISILLLLFWLFNCQSGKQESDAMADPATAESDATPIAETIVFNDTITYEYASFEGGYNIFEDLNYTPEAWQSGIREIPNLHLMKVPQRWRQSTTQEIEVKMKKAIFFRALAPLALTVNGEIEKEREELQQIFKKGLEAVSADEAQWLHQLAVRYKLIKAEENLQANQLGELMNRVDQIPLSLVLAQSAEESGWGTSRFAAEGNALFGQWAWGANAIKPDQQREGMGDYGIARFDSPLGSMRAYMHNLNTHNAYSGLRKVRAEVRASGKQPDGATLAQTLTKYSERGQEYVKTLLSIMRVNHLAQADSAYLKEDPVILMVPLE